MNSPMRNSQIADGVAFHCVIDSRFKTNRLSVNLITRLQKDTVTINALIPRVLKRGFHGCEDFTQLNRKCEELYGAYIEADVQKRGDHQILSLAITAIDNRYALQGEALSEKAADILCNMLLNPNIHDNGFDAKYVDLEKKGLADTIEAEINEKRTYSLNHLVRLMCAEEPYGLPKHGFLDQIEGITPQSAKKQYDLLISQSRIEILFTGSGSSEGAEQVFRSAFQKVSRSYQETSPSQPHPVTDREIAEQQEKMEVSQCKMVMGFANGLSALSPELPAMRLMTAILGGTATSKLFLNVREKLSLCYYCAARVDIYKGILTIDSGVEQKNINKAQEEILAQLKLIKEGAISEEELQTALLSLENAYTNIYESDISIESFFLGQLLSGANSTPELEKEKLRKVTKEEIQKAAGMLKLDAVYLLTGEDE